MNLSRDDAVIFSIFQKLSERGKGIISAEIHSRYQQEHFQQQQEFFETMKKSITVTKIRKR